MASLIDKAANVAGLTRTCEVMRRGPCAVRVHATAAPVKRWSVRCFIRSCGLGLTADCCTA